MLYDYDLHMKAPRPLIEDARRQAPGLSLAGVVRLALARFAQWPDSAALTVAGPARTPAPEQRRVSVEGSTRA